MSVATLPTILSRPFHRGEALRLVRRWQQSGKRYHLDQAFVALAPLIRIRLGRELWGLSRQDVEEIESYAALRLWQILGRRALPKFVNDAALSGWCHAVITNILRNGMRDCLLEPLPARVDRVMAARNLCTPRDGSTIATENAIFLEELPDAIWRRATTSELRVNSEEFPALRYAIQRLFQGRAPALGTLQREFGLSAERAKFVEGYAMFSVRRTLYEMYEEAPEVLLAHPVGFVLAEDEEHDQDPQARNASAFGAA